MSTQSALDNYFEPREVDRDFSWRCDMDGGCQSERLPLKQHRLSEAPTVLCLQLVRWRTGGVHGALLHAVACEQEISCGGVPYALHSVICHTGRTPKSGHHTCRIRSASAEGAWWYYNDSEHRLVRTGEVETTALVDGIEERAYVAFYEKA